MGTLPIFMVPIADLNIAVSIFRVKSLKYSWLGSNGFLMIHFNACLFIFYWHLLCDDADANILIHHFKRYLNSMPQLSNYNNLLPIKVKILMYLFYPWALLPLSNSLVPGKEMRIVLGHFTQIPFKRPFSHQVLHLFRAYCVGGRT